MKDSIGFLSGISESGQSYLISIMSLNLNIKKKLLSFWNLPQFYQILLNFWRYLSKNKRKLISFEF